MDLPYRYYRYSKAASEIYSKEIGVLTFQKQPQGCSVRKGVHRNFAKFT